MAQVYINKQDKEAAEILFLIYKNAMESGGTLAFKENGDEDDEAHNLLVDKIDVLLEKLRYSM
ncbi:hypothetical protein [Paenibacillus taichungensis]|uniref:hypothetical protein n=1 Tax=Paenibacillus taichungensis TaxID=484184 RepID=UPI00399F142A